MASDTSSELQASQQPSQEPSQQPSQNRAAPAHTSDIEQGKFVTLITSNIQILFILAESKLSLLQELLVYILQMIRMSSTQQMKITPLS